MAQVIVTIKLMPSSPETDLKKIEEKAVEEIKKFGGQIGRIEQEPIAFGIKALKISFFSDESKSNLDPLEESLGKIKEVESVETTEVRRALI
ncbi:MAG: elongation factor 1-beta [Nanoarchaeota archaeon]